VTGGAEALPSVLRAAFVPEPPPPRLGVAVSGGSDSLALLHLLADWAAAGGPTLAAVTVDHGLRPEAAAEAAGVARICHSLDVPHQTLHWRGWDGQGNLPDRARRARYGLMADWARAAGIGAVALGHTIDDQAETFLLRLARGSGVDGLSAMAVRRRDRGIDWWRPLLTARRADLRAWLTARGLTWADDPGNEDARYDRVQARHMLAALAPLGIAAETLAETAGRMRLARQALARMAHDLARAAVWIQAGDVIFDRETFAAGAEETRLRLLAHALCWVARADYRPRLVALKGALAAAERGERTTLHGCLILPRKATLRVAREPAAVGPEVPAPGLWDGRWRVSGPDGAGLTVRALGPAGLERLPGWRASGLPRATALALPAIWRGPDLVAVPHLDAAHGWGAELHHGAEDFFTSLIVH